MRVQCYGTCPAVVSRSLGYLGLEAISKLKDLTHALIPYLVTRYLIVFWPPLGKTHWTACTGWPVTGTRATSQLSSTLSSPTSMSVSSSPVPNATPPVPNATHPRAHGERVDRRYGEVSPAPYHTPIHTPIPHTHHTHPYTHTHHTHPYIHPHHAHTHTHIHTIHNTHHTHIPYHTHSTHPYTHIHSTHTPTHPYTHTSTPHHTHQK